MDTRSRLSCSDCAACSCLGSRQAPPGSAFTDLLRCLSRGPHEGTHTDTILSGRLCDALLLGPPQPQPARSPTIAEHQTRRRDPQLGGDTRGSRILLAGQAWGHCRSQLPVVPCACAPGAVSEETGAAAGRREGRWPAKQASGRWQAGEAGKGARRCERGTGRRAPAGA